MSLTLHAEFEKSGSCPMRLRYGEVREWQQAAAPPQTLSSMPRARHPARVTMLDDGVGPLASKMSSTTSDRRAKFSRITE